MDGDAFCRAAISIKYCRACLTANALLDSINSQFGHPTKGSKSSVNENWWFLNHLILREIRRRFDVRSAEMPRAHLGSLLNLRPQMIQLIVCAIIVLMEIESQGCLFSIIFQHDLLRSKATTWTNHTPAKVVDRQICSASGRRRNGKLTTSLVFHWQRKIQSPRRCRHRRRRQEWFIWARTVAQRNNDARVIC